MAYKIGVNLFESRIVWISGPHRGAKDNVTNWLKSKLTTTCRIVGDKGYVGDEKDGDNGGFDLDKVKQRHKALNGRLKEFAFLRE